MVAIVGGGLREEEKGDEELRVGGEGFGWKLAIGLHGVQLSFVERGINRG